MKFKKLKRVVAAAFVCVTMLTTSVLSYVASSEMVLEGSSVLANDEQVVPKLPTGDEIDYLMMEDTEELRSFFMENVLPPSERTQFTIETYDLPTVIDESYTEYNYNDSQISSDHSELGKYNIQSR